MVGLRKGRRKRKRETGELNRKPSRISPSGKLKLGEGQQDR